MTIFSVYRVLDAPGKLKLSTIEDPFDGNWYSLGVIQNELKVLTSRYFGLLPGKAKIQPWKLLYLTTSSPSFKVSFFGLLSDIRMLNEYGLLSSLEVLLTAKVSVDSLLGEFYTGLKRLALKDGCSPSFNLFSKEGALGIGQLSIKKEAAGKLRVFAMVDLWTQIAMWPLHRFLFDFLKNLPNDGTHDQQASVKRCFEKVGYSSRSFGFDLSAATDRLPIAIQMTIVEQLLGARFALA